MHIKTISRVLGSTLLFIYLSSFPIDANAVNPFTYIKNSITGSGTGEITSLDNNKFDISLQHPFHK